MNKIAGLILVLLMTVQAEAQLKKAYKRVKQAVTGSAKLSHLHYFPKQWEVDLGAGARYTILDYKGNSSGLTFLEAEQKMSTLSGSLALGLTNIMYVQMDFGYQLASDVTYTKPSQPGSKSKGLVNPAFSGVIRLLEGDSINIDLKGKFEASTGDRQSSDATHEGNAQSGGHAFGAGAKIIASITDSSQLSAALDYKMMALRSAVDQSTKINYEDDKHNEVLITLSTMTELTSDLFFGVNLEVVNVDAYKTTNLSTKATSNTGSVSAKTLNLIGKYELTPDSLMQIEANYMIDYKEAGNNYDITATGYGLGASYLVRF
jgi:hypothetical protein